MAQKRAISTKVVDTDAFLSMPQSTQLLYMHLLVRGDDDGFLDNPKSVMSLCRANEDDFKILMAKQYIIPFDSGVIVIRHWRIHALIRCDRYKPTEYQSERSQLEIGSDNAYVLADKGQLSIDAVSEAKELSAPAEEKPKISILKEFLNVYSKYPCSIGKNKKSSLNLYYSWLNGKNITVMGTRKLVRYNHIQILFALKYFIAAHETNEEQYIPRLPTFLGERTLCDYIASSRNEYERYMFEKFGEDWTKVKFEYDKGDTK